MSFDVKKFKKTKHTQRVADCPIPDLARFCSDPQKPYWRVRGLTGQELGQTKEAAARNKNAGAMVEAIAAGSTKEKIEGMKTALGIGTVTDNIAERIEQLVIGSVEPKMDTELAVMLCERYPVEFYDLTNKILQLTGQGMQPGELRGSGKTEVSEQV